MPRTLRFEQDGAIYHVLNRGNYRADKMADWKVALAAAMKARVRDVFTTKAP